MNNQLSTKLSDEAQALLLRVGAVSGSTVLLDETQTAIIQGKICPYCKGKTEYVDSSVIYGKSYGMIYLCSPCDAYCGVHWGTDKSLGRLANKELRKAKIEAHKYFDVIWKEGHEERGEVYKHLANHLKLPVEYCHIGMFSVKTCQKVVDWSKMILNDLRRLDMDFGQDVKRPHYERD